MLLEHLLQYDIKRRALELQHLLLEHPYGDYLEIELDYQPWQDVFDGTNVNLGPAVMDKPTVVMTVNDKFDSERVDQFGPDGIKVVMTQDYIFMTMFSDEPNKFVQFDGKGSLKADHFDQVIVNRVLKHFIVMPSSSRLHDAFFDSKEADAGVSQGLSFMVNHDDPKFYRHKDTLTSKGIRVGQRLLVRSYKGFHPGVNSTGIATILELKAITSGEQQFSSMLEAFKHFKATSLSSLIKATTRENRVVLACKDVGTDVDTSVHMRMMGASGSWSYDREPCSLALMEQV